MNPLNALSLRPKQMEGDCEQAYTPSLLDGYKRQLLQAEGRVTALKNTIKFLEENPKFEEFFKLAASI